MSTIVYITAGEVTDTGIADGSARLFDGMLEAQDALGQITWHDLTWNIAMGVRGGERIAVFDLDTANGLEVIHVTNWVNGHSDIRPEITR